MDVGVLTHSFLITCRHLIKVPSYITSRLDAFHVVTHPRLLAHISFIAIWPQILFEPHFSKWWLANTIRICLLLRI